MSERPILFSGPMVRAILEGRKSQTRRIAKLTASGNVKEPRGQKFAITLLLWAANARRRAMQEPKQRDLFERPAA